MSDETKRYDGPNHDGAAHSAPYGLSRMAPAIDLVDMAREIKQADALLGAVAADKLGQIAEQIRALQEQARALLEKTRRDASLHRVPCRFAKVPGQVYHLYRRDPNDEASRFWSILSPDDWRGRLPGEHLGAYRLESDQSFTAAADIEAREQRALGARHLLGG
ncbi:MAG: DUF2452 domain-containing protein [Myxococcales bacterium]|nr:DUF2452 domain-containing protein [Myxococcales bacterium]